MSSLKPLVLLTKQFHCFHWSLSVSLHATGNPLTPTTRIPPADISLFHNLQAGHGHSKMPWCSSGNRSRQIWRGWRWMIARYYIMQAICLTHYTHILTTPMQERDLHARQSENLILHVFPDFWRLDHFSRQKMVQNANFQSRHTTVDLKKNLIYPHLVLSGASVLATQVKTRLQCFTDTLNLAWRKILTNPEDIFYSCKHKKNVFHIENTFLSWLRHFFPVCSTFLRVN